MKMDNERAERAYQIAQWTKELGRLIGKTPEEIWEKHTDQSTKDLFTWEEINIFI